MYSLIILGISARLQYADVESRYACFEINNTGEHDKFLSTEHDEFVSTDFSVNGGYTL